MRTDFRPVLADHHHHHTFSNIWGKTCVMMNDEAEISCLSTRAESRATTEYLFPINE